MAQVLKSNLKNHMAIDRQVYFYKQLFANPVKLPWCITGPVEPLGSTNQNCLSVELLPMHMFVLTYPADCVHLYRLLETQSHCLCPNGRVNLPLACPPTHTTSRPPSHPPFSHPPTPYIWHPWYYKGCKKTISKTSSEYCMAELAMKQ